MQSSYWQPFDRLRAADGERWTVDGEEVWLTFSKLRAGRFDCPFDFSQGKAQGTAQVADLR